MYVTNLKHLLDADGEVAQSDNKAWKQIANFLVIVVDTVTQMTSHIKSTTYLRCFKKRCKGKICAGINEDDDSIEWTCSECGNSGIIREWKGSKWDNSFVKSS